MSAAMNMQEQTAQETERLEPQKVSKDFEFYWGDETTEERTAIGEYQIAHPDASPLAAVVHLSNNRLIARPANLTLVPPSISEVENSPDVQRWWNRLLKKAGVTVKGVVVKEDRFWTIVYRLAINDLANRLRGEHNPMRRARAWYHVTEACVPGQGDITDLTEKTMYYLNPFLPAEQRFPSPLDALREDDAVDARFCANPKCKNGVNGPKLLTGRQLTCSQTCRQATRRLSQKTVPSANIQCPSVTSGAIENTNT